MVHYLLFLQLSLAVPLLPPLLFLLLLEFLPAYLLLPLKLLPAGLAVGVESASAGVVIEAVGADRSNGVFAAIDLLPFLLFLPPSRFVAISEFPLLPLHAQLSQLLNIFTAFEGGLFLLYFKQLVAVFLSVHFGAHLLHVYHLSLPPRPLLLVRHNWNRCLRRRRMDPRGEQSAGGERRRDWLKIDAILLEFVPGPTHPKVHGVGLGPGNRGGLGINDNDFNVCIIGAVKGLPVALLALDDFEQFLAVFFAFHNASKYYGWPHQRLAAECFHKCIHHPTYRYDV